MSWSYYPDGTERTERDVIRELVADTDPEDQLAQDEAIDKYRTGGDLAQTSTYAAASKVAGEIALKFVRMAKSVSAGGSRVEWENRAEFYGKLETSLLDEAPGGGASPVPYAGGISVTDVAGRQANTNRVRGRFERDIWPDTRWGYRR